MVTQNRYYLKFHMERVAILKISLQVPMRTRMRYQYQTIRNILSLIMLRPRTQRAFFFSCPPPGPYLTQAVIAENNKSMESLWNEGRSRN